MRCLLVITRWWLLVINSKMYFLFSTWAYSDSVKRILKKSTNVPFIELSGNRFWKWRRFFLGSSSLLDVLVSCNKVFIPSWTNFTNCSKQSSFSKILSILELQLQLESILLKSTIWNKMTIQYPCSGMSNACQLKCCYVEMLKIIYFATGV